MKKVILVYVPVAHNGYIQFFERHQPADICVIGVGKLKEIDSAIGDRMSRNISARPVDHIVNDLRYAFPNISIEVFGGIQTIMERYDQVVMPDEDISHVLKEQLYLVDVEFDIWFLRWDWTKTQVQKTAEGNFAITTEDSHRFFMAIAVEQAGGSSDWWRQVGAVLPYGENAALTSFNLHLPTPSEPYVFGDVRLNMKPGEKPEVCTAIHAEQRLLGEALRRGISTLEKDMYVTTFPCPVCAKLIAVSGIKRLFFKEGYSTLDALDVLVHAGVEIFQVK